MQRLLDDVVALTVRLGGTLAGEHGDGRLRAPLLKRMWHKDSVQAFEVLKKAFDPDNIFNPGAKIPLPGQKALRRHQVRPGSQASPRGGTRGSRRCREETGVQRIPAVADSRIILVFCRSSMIASSSAAANSRPPTAPGR